MKEGRKEGREGEIDSFVHIDMILLAPTNIVVTCRHQPQKISQLCIGE